jgi:hypothetical protein
MELFGPVAAGAAAAPGACAALPHLPNSSAVFGPETMGSRSPAAHRRLLLGLQAIAAGTTTSAARASRAVPAGGLSAGTLPHPGQNRCPAGPLTRRPGARRPGAAWPSGRPTPPGTSPCRVPIDDPVRRRPGYSAGPVCVERTITTTVGIAVGSTRQGCASDAVARPMTGRTRPLGGCARPVRPCWRVGPTPGACVNPVRAAVRVGSCIQRTTPLGSCARRTDATRGTNSCAAGRAPQARPAPRAVAGEPSQRMSADRRRQLRSGPCAGSGLALRRSDGVLEITQSLGRGSARQREAARGARRRP